MSPLSQTPQPRLNQRLWGPVIWIAVTSVVAGALAPFREPILKAAASTQAHLPDLALLARQPAVVQIHLYAALASIVLGWALIFARKGRRFHRTAGWAWVSLAAVVAGSSLFITGLNGDRWSLLHLLTGWTFLVLPLGVLAAKRRSVQTHRRLMSGLFYGGFAANLFIAFIPGRLLWSLLLG